MQLNLLKFAETVELIGSLLCLFIVEGQNVIGTGEVTVCIFVILLQSYW